MYWLQLYPHRLGILDQGAAALGNVAASCDKGKESSRGFAWTITNSGSEMILATLFSHLLAKTS